MEIQRPLQTCIDPNPGGVHDQRVRQAQGFIQVFPVVQDAGAGFGIRVEKNGHPSPTGVDLVGLKRYNFCAEKQNQGSAEPMVLIFLDLIPPQLEPSSSRRTCMYL